MAEPIRLSRVSEPRVIMRRKVVRISALAAAVSLAVMTAEVVFVLRREYIKDGPELPISGNFGDPSLPTLRFAVLGDSTSVGLGTVPEASFPWRLASKLGKHFNVDLVVLGAPGAQTADVAGSQVHRAIEFNPDLVLIEIGANDATHVTPVKKVSEDATRAIRTLKAAQIRVVVAGPPAMGTSRAFPQPLRALSGLNGRRMMRAFESVARTEGVAYIDLASKTRRAFQENPGRFYSSDGFHPGATGYKLWADAMYPEVRRAALKTISSRRLTDSGVPAPPPVPDP